MKNTLAVFENFNIRRIYDEKSETWVFSVVDIIQALIQQPNYQTARKYWNKLKERLKTEGSQLVTNCHQLKMTAEDGKMRLTDVADPETLLRLIQSVPSPKAEPIKLWLAKVGYERMQDMADPARSVDRAREYWQQHGRSEKWIQQRMMGQETRNKLTDYWKDHDIKQEEEYGGPWGQVLKYKKLTFQDLTPNVPGLRPAHGQIRVRRISGGQADCAYQKAQRARRGRTHPHLLRGPAQDHKGHRRHDRRIRGQAGGDHAGTYQDIRGDRTRKTLCCSQTSQTENRKGRTYRHRARRIKGAS